MRKFSREEVQAALNRVPEQIREAFLSEETSEVIFELKTKFKLHVDVAGELGQQVGYLMVGLISPSEFFGNIMLSGTDESTARALMQEINQKIFVPLQQSIKSKKAAGDINLGPVPSVSTSAPSISATIPKPEALPLPTIQYTEGIMLPGSAVPAPMPHSTQPIVAHVVPAGSHQQSVSPGQNWHPAAALHIFVPSQAPMHQTPHAAFPVQAQVVDMTQRPQLEVSKPISTELPKPATSLRPEGVSPIVKSYSSDPYREPI